MSTSVSESFRYAFSRELLPLYAAVALGWLLLNIPIPPVSPEVITVAASALVGLLGVALLVGGAVGIVHQIVDDAT